ncbi:MAG: hypothetical protein E7015_02745 [Alphaproteobacteria bacterium]|nr:hypothetical protein [Alphaproteobacteria bacterium]
MSSSEILISADDIFSSELKGYEKYSRIIHVSNAFSRSVIYGGDKIADAMLNAEELQVEMFQGCHCAMLLGRLAKSVVISKITVLYTQLFSEERTEFCKKEFGKCVLQSFLEKDDICTFTAKYSSLNISYTDLKSDGTKRGSAAAQIDVLKWKVENK